MTARARLRMAIALGLALAACSGTLSAVATPARAATPGSATTTPPTTTTPSPATTTPAGAAAVTSPAPAATSPQTITGDTKTVVRTIDSSQNSGVAIAVITVVCVLALGLLAWEAARWWAYEPGWALRLRHALAEAGLRWAEIWSELLDWARGR